MITGFVNGESTTDAVADLITPFITLVVGIVLGYLAKYLHDRRAKRALQQQISRSLVAPARKIVDELSHAHVHFVQSENESMDALTYFFNGRRELFQSRDFSDLEEAARKTDNLCLRCLEKWREAVQSLVDLKLKHQSVRSMMRVPADAEDLPLHIRTYGRLLNDALVKTKEAFRGTKPYGDRDTKQLVSEVIGEP